MTAVQGGEITCGDRSNRQVGITSTPVIDPATDTIYAVMDTWDGSDKSSVRHELVALDLATGAMRAGFPRVVDPTSPQRWRRQCSCSARGSHSTATRS